MGKIQKELKLMKEVLEEGEEILSYVDGAFETTINNKNNIRTGVLAATNKKIRFCGKRFIWVCNDTIEYDNIYKVEVNEETLGYRIFINCKLKSYFMKYIISDEIHNFVNVINQRKGKKIKGNQ